MNRIKKTIIQVVKKSGRMLLEEFKNFDRSKVELKSQHEVLTKADLKSEKIIISEIKNNFPDHQILSEEAGDNKKKSDYLWIIDPVDGSTNFSIHNPLWAVSVGVAFRKKIILGAVYIPVMDELFVAEKDKGAFLNGKKIQVSQIKSGKVINTYCHGNTKRDIKKAIQYFQKQKLNQLDCRQLGSASSELAYVASGRVESIVIPGANSWDVVAGILLVREAGGKVTDFSGKPWSLSSRDMVASNGRVHGDILKVLK